MIGRFAKPGVYRELFRSKDFYPVAAGGILALLSYLVDGAAPGTSMTAQILALVSAGLNGFPIIWGAVKGLMEREVNVDELVSLAIIASLIQGEFLTAAVVSFVMTFGGLIEEATSESARRAIKSLVSISPETATVLKDGAETAVPLERVRPGDMIRIKPGERVPVDARILSGYSSIDESVMTGEPLPVDKKAGDDILAGTLNHNGVLTAEATKTGEDSALGKVIQLVREAEAHRPESVRLMDRYAAWFTPLILLCAAGAWIFTGEINRAVAVLIAGCPCALILAAPTAAVAALGRAARAGILVKGGQYLERSAAVKAVLFDKTGTLTLGEPLVEEVCAIEGMDENEVIAYAASAEKHCSHPLARAILKAAHDKRITVQEADETFLDIGQGIRATVDGVSIVVKGADPALGEGDFPQRLLQGIQRAAQLGATPLVVYRNHIPVGLITVTDQIRPEGPATVEQLKKTGINEFAILSGDHQKAVERVGQAVGIHQLYGRLKPQDKVKQIIARQSQNLPVMFVGDGVNDAPALAASQVGVAMAAAGTDVALETADIALIHDRIDGLPWLICLSRRMLAIIKINIAFGLLFNSAAVIAGGMGWLSPIMAAIVHNAGSVLVVLASASLAFFPNQERRYRIDTSA